MKQYKTFEECVSENQDKKNPEGYCAYLHREKTRMEKLEKLYERVCKENKKLTNFKYEKFTQTIRSVPENYWIASVKNGKVIFDSWDKAIVGRYDKQEVINWFNKNHKESLSTTQKLHESVSTKFTDKTPAQKQLKNNMLKLEKQLLQMTGAKNVNIDKDGGSIGNIIIVNPKRKIGEQAIKKLVPRIFDYQDESEDVGTIFFRFYLTDFMKESLSIERLTYDGIGTPNEILSGFEKLSNNMKSHLNTYTLKKSGVEVRISFFKNNIFPNGRYTLKYNGEEYSTERKSDLLNRLKELNTLSKESLSRLDSLHERVCKEADSWLIQGIDQLFDTVTKGVWKAGDPRIQKYLDDIEKKIKQSGEKIPQRQQGRLKLIKDFTKPIKTGKESLSVKRVRKEGFVGLGNSLPSNWNRLYTFGDETKGMTHEQVISKIKSIPEREWRFRNLLMPTKATKYYTREKPVFSGSALDNIKQADYQYEIFTLIKKYNLKYLMPQSVSNESAQVKESLSALDRLHERVCKESKFKKGQSIKIKKQYLDDPRENDLNYVVLEDKGDRLLIKPRNTKLSIPPQTTIKKYMVESLSTKNVRKEAWRIRRVKTFKLFAPNYGYKIGESPERSIKKKIDEFNRLNKTDASYISGKWKDDTKKTFEFKVDIGDIEKKKFADYNGFEESFSTKNVRKEGVDVFDMNKKKVGTYSNGKLNITSYKPNSNYLIKDKTGKFVDMDDYIFNNK